MLRFFCSFQASPLLIQIQEQLFLIFYCLMCHSWIILYLPPPQGNTVSWPEYSIMAFLKNKLEPIIQSEVSQKEKHQYSILTHIYGI